MIFNKKEEEELSSDTSETATPKEATQFAVLAKTSILEDRSFLEAVRNQAGSLEVSAIDPSSSNVNSLASAKAVLSVFQSTEELSSLMANLKQLRAQRQNGYPIAIVCVRLDQLTEFGNWLYQSAQEDCVEGIRLIAANNYAEIPEQISDKLDPIVDPNVIKMPVSPEVQEEEKEYKYFFTISPELRNVVSTMRQLAENSMTRLYLLGGPGTGKSTAAYYYWLCRGSGNFITVNLNSESTDDKSSMKSLLCGHVAGAFPGASAREGALSFARDGVCFLDESHGVTGQVMQVLMEVLDSGQFMPYGATNKRKLECAVIFASNRGWDTLTSLMQLDEHARLGATIIRIPDMTSRREDMIAVLAAMLGKFSKQCKTWTPPKGLTEESWSVINNCAWHGNLRTLMRVIEAAGIAHGLAAETSELLEAKYLKDAIALWEPEEHESLSIYTSE